MKTLNNVIFVLVFMGCSSFIRADQVEIDRVKVLSNLHDIDAMVSLKHRYQGYDLAFLHYHLASVYHAKQLIHKAVYELENGMAVLNKQPNDAEALILLAYLYSYKAGLEPDKASVYGTKSHLILDKAAIVSFNNPRFLLVNAIIKGNTPIAYGGSTQKAILLLSDAIDVFGSDRYVPSDAEWGYVDAYIWRGIFYKQQGDVDQAYADWRQALVFNPESGWVKRLLSE